AGSLAHKPRYVLSWLVFCSRVAEQVTIPRLSRRLRPRDRAPTHRLVRSSVPRMHFNGFVRGVLTSACVCRCCTGYMLLRDTFLYYESSRTPIGDLQAVNLTAVVGAKGGNDVRLRSVMFV